MKNFGLRFQNILTVCCVMITVGYISVDKWIETRPALAAPPPQDSAELKENDSKWRAFVDKSGG